MSKELFKVVVAIVAFEAAASAYVAIHWPPSTETVISGVCAGICATVLFAVRVARRWAEPDDPAVAREKWAEMSDTTVKLSLATGAALGLVLIVLMYRWPFAVAVAGMIFLPAGGIGAVIELLRRPRSSRIHRLWGDSD